VQADRTGRCIAVKTFATGCWPVAGVKILQALPRCCLKARASASSSTTKARTAEEPRPKATQTQNACDQAAARVGQDATPTHAARGEDDDRRCCAAGRKQNGRRPRALDKARGGGRPAPVRRAPHCVHRSPAPTNRMRREVPGHRARDGVRRGRGREGRGNTRGHARMHTRNRTRTGHPLRPNSQSATDANFSRSQRWGQTPRGPAPCRRLCSRPP